MRSLQVKLTLTLMLSSLIAIAMVGLVSRHLMLNKFNSFVEEDAFRRFQGDVRAYIVKYGSWEQAQKTEPFTHFMHQRQALLKAPMPGALQDANNAAPPGGQTPTLTGDTPSLNDNAPNGDNPPNGEPPPNDGPPSMGQLNGANGAPNAGRKGPEGGPPQGPRGDGPFRFDLLDPDGRILLGEIAHRGELAPPELRVKAVPITVKSQVVAYAVPVGRPNFSRDDTENWNALQHALLSGVLAASCVTLGLGVFAGSQLSRKLRELTTAIQAMGQGELRQEVSVHSEDEIGILATAFNRMSLDLAQAHEALQQSHARIEQQAQQLKEISIRDELTKLYNRRHFNDQAAIAYAQAARYEQPLTVMIGDIDFFKRINDNFSHATGDAVLRHIAGIMQNQTRHSDLVARYGGEEFVIAFPLTPLPVAVELCERLRHVVETYPWHKIHPDLRVTMSMGLNDNLSLGSMEAMLAEADEKLYQAKADGRNRVYADGARATLKSSAGSSSD